MARPQIAVGRTAPSSMEGICVYIKQAEAESGKWVVLQSWGLGEVLKIPHRKTVTWYETFTNVSGLD